MAKQFWNCRGPTGHMIAVLFAVLLCAACILRETRRVALFVLLPFLLLYGVLFSYEIRVAAPCFPLVAFVCGFPAERVARVGRFLDRYRLLGCRAGSIGALMLVIVAALVLRAGSHAATHSLSAAIPSSFSSGAVTVAAAAIFCLFCLRLGSCQLNLRGTALLAVCALVSYGLVNQPRDRVLAQQRELLRNIGSPALNARIYAAVRERGIDSGILTSYWYFRELPDIEHLYRPAICRTPCTIEALRRLSAEYSDSGYMLLPDAAIAPETKSALARSTDFTIVFSDPGGWLFLEINAAISAVAHN